MSAAKKLKPVVFKPLAHAMRVLPMIAKGFERAQKKGKAPHSEWSSEKRWFKAISARYGPFDLDVAAADWNAKCPRYFTKKQNALQQRFAGRCWMNSPYNPSGTIEKFMAYARAQAIFNGAVRLVACLVPHYTAEGWWRRTVVKHEDLGKLLSVEWFEDELGACTVRRYERLEIRVHELPGRVRFMSREGQNDPARYSSAVVVYRRPEDAR